MGRISKMKRDLIMESNKKLLNETKGGPDLTNCHWFFMDVNYLDGKIGELHLTQQEKGFWFLEKFTNPQDLEQSIKGTIEVPQQNDIEVMWDDERKAIKLVGKSLLGLEAYNTVFRTNEDEYSGKLIYATDQSPSRYGITRDYQYLHFAKITLVESKKEPIGVTNEVKMKNGAIINLESYFVDRKLFKKEYKFIVAYDDTKIGTSMNRCDKYDIEH